MTVHAQDLKVLGGLCSRARDCVAQLQRLAQFTTPNDPADAATQLLLDIGSLWEQIGAATRMVQDREARSWKSDHPPRHPARPRLTRPRSLPLSTTVGGVAVTKCPPAAATNAFLRFER